MKKNLFYILLLLSVFSCTEKIEKVDKAFYFWKTECCSAEEIKLCDSLEVEKLYIKLFEVEYDESMGAIPISKSYFYSNKNTIQEYIPCVFIKNEVFIKLDTEHLDLLAENVNFLINKKLNRMSYHLKDSVTEFQIDCDWTLKSKENYFYFLKKIKEISKKKISCTLRLYPYKFSEKLGVPPVDKCVLMCYNLINPAIDKTRNSILDNDELEKYLYPRKEYPIHLDIALPTYSWMQVYQNNQFTQVLYNDFEKIIPILEPIDKLWFEVTEDLAIKNIYLRIGDKIKFDQVKANEILEAISIIQKNVPLDNNTTIALFHLDAEQLNHYSNEELQSFYTSFTE